MALLDTQGKFVLISLETTDSFIFDLFPTRDQGIQSTDRANWEEQDVTIGTKPLIYSSKQPRKISVPELILDGSRTNESIGPKIDALRKLGLEHKRKVIVNGVTKISNAAPPALLAIWGDRQERCVMEELVVTETVFTKNGDPLRARISLQLVEIQKVREVVTSSAIPLDDGPPVGG